MIARRPCLLLSCYSALRWWHKCEDERGIECGNLRYACVFVLGIARAYDSAQVLLVFSLHFQYSGTSPQGALHIEICQRDSCHESTQSLPDSEGRRGALEYSGLCYHFPHNIHMRWNCGCIDTTWSSIHILLAH